MDINIGFFSNKMWMYQIFGIVFATLVLDFLQKKILSKIYRKLKRTQTIWDDVYRINKKPTESFIWLYGILIAFQFAPAQNIFFNPVS